MAKNATINLRVDSEVKKQAAEILEGLGLTLSDAFNLLLHQVKIVKGLPFEVKHGTQEPYVCAYGYLHDYSKKADYENDIAGAKKYTNLSEMWADMDAEDDNDEI
ncbi:MAG: type II toxin-antitoxin system RelB/DinJ family antitoxin [Defluviitaleaceae bacterium]|nr:type II toxin-antitoxin system RelB/DinJ family antitoxin [Defluviitaleaceae bacterium]